MQRHIRKGDLVEVLAGRDKGKRGEVLQVYPERGRILVRNVNLVMRYSRPNRRLPKGGMIETEDFVSLANVRLVPEQSLAARLVS